jgi:hypothetical protein
MSQAFLCELGFSKFSSLVGIDDFSIKCLFHFYGFQDNVNQMIVLGNLIETGIEKILSALRTFNLGLILSVYFVNACFTERVPTC